ncbi:DsbA family protein [Microbacterium sp. NPDC091313]
MAAVARKTNWFAIGVSIAVVVVLVVVGLVVYLGNTAATSPGEAPESSAVNADTGAIAVGSGSGTVDTYIDFMCPICNQFEQTYGDTLQQLSSDGTITLNIHPISILDRQSQGTEYSTRAANAAYCVAVDDPKNVLTFVQTLYANQPEEGSTGLTDDQLAAYAQQSGASASVASCISDGTYKKYVTAMTRNTPVQPGGSGIATPTIAVNGTVLSNSADLTGNPQTDFIDRLKS